MNRSLAYAALVMALAFSLAGCAENNVATEPVPEPAAPPAATPEAPAPEPDPEPSAAAIAWTGTALTDAVTGEKFKLSDYKGKPVLLHSFAVW